MNEQNIVKGIEVDDAKLLAADAWVHQNKVDIGELVKEAEGRIGKLSPVSEQDVRVNEGLTSLVQGGFVLWFKDAAGEGQFIKVYRAAIPGPVVVGATIFVSNGEFSGARQVGRLFARIVIGQEDEVPEETTVTAFSRSEYIAIRRRAELLAAVPGLNHHWQRALIDLSDSANRLDAFIARSTVVRTTPTVEDEGKDALIDFLRGELQWCSGNPAFNEGGDARKGWIKGPAKVIKLTPKEALALEKSGGLKEEVEQPTAQPAAK